MRRRGTLCDCVKDICGRELPVRVWARGMSVRSNAALLLSGVMNQTPSACAALVLKEIKRNGKELTDWYATADGFLECAFAEDFVLFAAYESFSAARAIPVNDSHEKLFLKSARCCVPKACCHCRKKLRSCQRRKWTPRRMQCGARRNGRRAPMRAQRGFWKSGSTGSCRGQRGTIFTRARCSVRCRA